MLAGSGLSVKLSEEGWPKYEHNQAATQCHRKLRHFQIYKKSRIIVLRSLILKKQWANSQGIQWTFHGPYHSQASGITELWNDLSKLQRSVTLPPSPPPGQHSIVGHLVTKYGYPLKWFISGHFLSNDYVERDRKSYKTFEISGFHLDYSWAWYFSFHNSNCRPA